MIRDEILQVAKLHNDLVYFIQAETKDDYWNFDILSDEDTSNYLQEFIDTPERKIFIAKDKDLIVGFIAGEMIQCHLPISNVKTVGYISAAYVLPEYRGKGIMKKLESLLVEYFKKCGLKFIELNFISKNLLAKKNWECLGYEVFREQARKKL